MLSIDSGHSFLMLLILTQLSATSDERPHRHGLALTTDWQVILLILLLKHRRPCCVVVFGRRVEGFELLLARFENGFMIVHVVGRRRGKTCLIGDRTPFIIRAIVVRCCTLMLLQLLLILEMLRVDRLF